MKIIQLEERQLTIDELIKLARNETVVLRQADGAMFAIASVDDFEVEVEILKNNAEFMAFLKELSQEEATISLQSLREELAY